ncbi:MAG: hemolysin family protein [Calditrichaceae bacterium]
MEIYLTVIGLLLSIFFAGAEATYTGFDKMRLEVWKKQKLKFVDYTARYVKHPEHFFATILIGNNVANILYSTFATVFLLSYLDETLAWLIITIVVLFFGEIFPKNYFRTIADLIVLRVMFTVHIFYILFNPFVKIVNKLIELILRFLKIKHENVASFFSREELEMLLLEGHKAAFVEKADQKLLSNILDFSSSRVREAMTPRTEIIAAPENISWDGLHDLMIKSGKNKIPVYRKTVDDITGVIFIFDMLDERENIAEIIQPIHYVPETKSCAELLREFQEQNITLAVVIDEYGGTEGLVTMDDLIEVVFGEFEELFERRPKIRALNDHSWIVDTRIDIEELSDIVKIKFPDGEYETFAGYILEKMGHIPEINEKMDFKKYRIEITKANPKKVLQAKLIRKRR